MLQRICGEISEVESYVALYDKIEEESTKKYPSWNDSYDVRGSVVVYFHKKSTYVQTFLQSAGNVPKFTDERFVDFHYQNQSDPWYAFEENLSVNDKNKAARNWLTRKKVWDDIYSDGLDSPSQAGLSYDMCGTLDFHEITRRILERFR